MDAKPQRVRAHSRVQRDENAAPTNTSQMKTLHHSRNKSTPALSSLLKNPVKTTIGLNNAKPRTVFGDVSNTRGGPHASNIPLNNTKAKDDLAMLKNGLAGMVGKVTALQPLREVPDDHQQLNKQPALLRPAQRPLSALLPKEAPAPQSMTTVSTAPSKPVVPTKHDAQTDPDAIVKILNKKRTTVFREQPVEPDQELISITKDFAPAKASTAPVHQLLNNICEKQLPTLPTADPVLPSVVPNQGLELKEEAHDFSRDLIESIEQTFAQVEEAAAAPRPEEQGVPVADISSRTSSQETILQVEPELRTSDQEVYLPALETQIPQVDGAMKLPISAHSDIPEYFEQDEEEYYDAEGYTTARSLRSLGDNTTGGLTTFLEPRVTARVLKELEAAAEFVRATQSEDDLEDEAWDTSMVAEYGDDIFEYMRRLENKMRPNEHYMDNQNEIQWSMRSVLMDWMIQVHTRFSLLPETLFLAVNYIDRFLSCKVVSLGKLQLVGATALFVAAKYEEINCPSVQEIVYMVDNAYTVDEILKAERFMLSMLQFELGWPGPMSFLRRISKADEYDLDTRTMAKYFLEVMIMDERFVACPPSFAAAGAHCLSRLVLDKGDWGLLHTHYAQYTWGQLYDLVAKLVECCQDPRKHHTAVYDKYQEKKYKRCSLVVEQKLQGGMFRLPSRNSSAYRDSAGSSWASNTFWRRC